MIVVDYTLSEDAVVLRDQQKMNLAKADLVDLCCFCFGSDLTLQVNGVDLSIVTGGGVQVLDFAVRFFSAGRSAASGKRVQIDFAGMADEIYVAPFGKSVTVTSNYTEEAAQATLEQFVGAGRTFLMRVLTDLIGKYPELRRNRGIRKAGSWVGVVI